MDRREHLKLLLAGSFGAGLLMTASCSEGDLEISERIIAENTNGRTEEELLRDEKLHAETFFTKAERKTVEALCDIIIPSDDVSGGAVDAGIPDFIEFMMKDVPSFQVPTRGGLMWMDNQSRKRFGDVFAHVASSEQLDLIDEIAYPDDAKPEMQYGVRFFNRMRNLVATGFFTSETGINDLGYQGNHPYLWDGVPEEVLDDHGLSYDQKTLEKCLKPNERSTIAEWDENGNLIR